MSKPVSIAVFIVLYALVLFAVVWHNTVGQSLVLAAFALFVLGAIWLLRTWLVQSRPHFVGVNNTSRVKFEISPVVLAFILGSAVFAMLRSGVSVSGETAETVKFDIPVIDAITPYIKLLPWTYILYVSLMLVGMAGSYFYKAIDDRRKSAAYQAYKTNLDAWEKADPATRGNPPVAPRLRFDTWDFVQPFLLSVGSFLGLATQFTDPLLSIPNASLCFETGFFWQTVNRK
jgi:hypothetical protein